MIGCNVVVGNVLGNWTQGAAEGAGGCCVASALARLARVAGTKRGFTSRAVGAGGGANARRGLAGGGADCTGVGISRNCKSARIDGIAQCVALGRGETLGTAVYGDGTILSINVGALVCWSLILRK